MTFQVKGGVPCPSRGALHSSAVILSSGWMSMWRSHVPGSSANECWSKIQRGEKRVLALHCVCLRMYVFVCLQVCSHPSFILILKGLTWFTRFRLFLFFCAEILCLIWETLCVGVSCFFVRGPILCNHPSPCEIQHQSSKYTHTVCQLWKPDVQGHYVIRPYSIPEIFFTWTTDVISVFRGLISSVFSNLISLCRATSVTSLCTVWTQKREAAFGPKKHRFNHHFQ